MVLAEGWDVVPAGKSGSFLVLQLLFNSAVYLLSGMEPPALLSLGAPSISPGSGLILNPLSLAPLGGMWFYLMK